MWGGVTSRPAKRTVSVGSPPEGDLQRDLATRTR